LDEHFSTYDILSPSQSAYRAHHSTETALLSFQDDLLLAAGRGHGIVVLLADSSAAFDTIDHDKLHDDLEVDCGISGVPLSWIDDYLDDRTECVGIDGVKSTPVKVRYGVPQGSVLGPKFYTVYVNNLRKLVEPYGITIKQFSDDTTIYLEFSFPPDIPDQFDALRILSSCAGDLINWSTFNMVKLNPAKSDFLYFAPAELADMLPPLPLRVGEEPLLPSSSAKLLGVVFSSDLSMDRQIASISRAANFNLYRLGKIRSCLTTEATKILVHSLVISHLDYANSLLAELPKKKLKPLQAIHDSAARLIYQGTFTTEESKFRLHWLPIYYRIRFKILLLIFDCLQGTAPVYLRDCIHLHVPGHTGIRRTARSLEVMSSRRKEKRRKKRSIPLKPAYQKRSFTNYAPQFWNTLPPAIRSTTDRLEFKKLLKTHFFTLSYPSLIV